MITAKTKYQKLDHLKSISVVMDSHFKGPGGIRFGLDAILGFIPFVGDFVTTLVSIYIIIQAAALGCTPATLTRMLLNVVIENAIDMIPILGSFFDIFWKANNRNISLLENHLVSPGAVSWKSRIIIGFICLIITVMLAGGVYLTLKLFALVWPN